MNIFHTICDYRELRDLKHRAQASREERDTLNAEQQQLLKEKSKLELTIKVYITPLISFQTYF